MHTYMLLHNADYGVYVYYFQSERTDLNHLTFGGEDFDEELTRAQKTKKSMAKYRKDNPQWGLVENLIDHFGIDFRPYSEDILIDMVPDEISTIPVLEKMG